MEGSASMAWAYSPTRKAVSLTTSSSGEGVGVHKIPKAETESVPISPDVHSATYRPHARKQSWKIWIELNYPP
jgi:hypothetical protein